MKNSVFDSIYGIGIRAKKNLLSHFGSIDNIKTAGIKDLEKKYYIDDLASGDIIFVATGVTEGTMVKGVKKYSNSFLTHSIVLRSDFNTTQFIQTYHPQSV